MSLNASNVLIATVAGGALAPNPQLASHMPGMEERPSVSSSTPMEFLKDSSFDVKLLQTIFKTKSNENILVSPASLKMTLALLLEGAGGTTALELQDAMKLPRNIALWQEQIASFQSALKADGKNLTVLSANGFFVSQGSKISPRYEGIAEHNYRSKVTALDFSNAKHAALIVNNWVQANTHGVIDRLISPGDLSADLKMLLVNTLYFKGKWQLGFSPKTTSLRCFNTFDGKCTKVPIMETSSFFNYTQLPSLHTQVIELPYSDDRYSMIIMLPQDGAAFNQLIKELPGQQLESILSKMLTKKVFVSMPRFSIEHTSHLVPVLQAIGVRELFSSTADLTGIFSSGEPVAVDKIVQKSKIDLDEHGAVAASATGTFVIPLSSSSATFDADKPFLFFLRDRVSGAILFEGIVSDPENFSSTTDSSESHPKPQISNKIPPISVATSPRPVGPSRPLTPATTFRPVVVHPLNNQDTLHPLSSLMPSTQYAYYNLNQPGQSLSNSNSNIDKPGIVPKIPESPASKNSSDNLHHGSKKPVVEYPQSEFYQKPIPNDQDAILFTANQTGKEKELISRGGSTQTQTPIQNQNTRSRPRLSVFIQQFQI